MKPNWTIVEYDGLEGFAELKSDWNRLVSEIPDRASLNSHASYSAYIRNLRSGDGRFVCFALSDGERIRAICPLEERQGTILGRKTQMWVSSRNHTFFQDVICPPDDAEKMLLPILIRHMRRTPARPPAWIVFDRVLEGSAFWRCLSAIGSRRYCAVSVGASDVFDCSRSFQDLTSSLSRNFRGNLRKARNKLAQLADVQFVQAIDRECLDREFPVFLEVEGSGWKGTPGIEYGAVRSRKQLLGFYGNLVRSNGDPVRCEINALYAEGRCIASELCVRGGTEYAIYKIGYDERYSRVAPGQLLLERTLERCCLDPVITRMNLVSDTAWHRDWRTDAIPVYSVHVGLGRWSTPLLVTILSMRLRYPDRIEQWMRRIAGGRRVLGWIGAAPAEGKSDNRP